MPSKIDSNRLIDRVGFKLYAPEKHLNNLQEIESKYRNMEKDDIEVQVEMEIDCFLSQIFGAIDCLLIQIDIKLELGISIEQVDLNTIQSALNARTKNIGLLTELHEASQFNRWLWTLKEFRNQTMQRPSKLIQDHFFDDKTRAFTSKQRNESLINADEYTNKYLIPYFQKIVKQVRQLVYKIRMKEPLLT
jgi:hypothetical protein